MCGHSSAQDTLGHVAIQSFQEVIARRAGRVTVFVRVLVVRGNTQHTEMMRCCCLFYNIVVRHYCCSTEGQSAEVVSGLSLLLLHMSELVCGRFLYYDT